MLRTGAQYLDSLRDGRQVWINGERVADVTTHPAFRPIVSLRARLYDMAHEAQHSAAMSYADDGSGERCNLALKLPRTQQDWHDKRAYVDAQLNEAGGVVVRVGDETIGELWSLWDGKAVLDEIDPKFGQNVERHIMRALTADPFHVSANTDPKGDRSKRPQEQDPDMLLHVVKETDAGIVVRGAKYETAAAYANQAFVKPTIGNWGDDKLSDYAVGFIADMGWPGIKHICRTGFAGRAPVEDYPLSNRFDEVDTLIVFDDVLVPWERVFLHGNVKLVAAAYAQTKVREFTTPQTNTRLLSKIEFVYGVLCLMAEAIGVQHAPAVQEMLGEAASYVEIIKSATLADEDEATVDPANGVIYPALQPLQVGRVWGPRIYPRMMEMVRRLGASGLMQTPASLAAFDSPLGDTLRKYYRGAKISAEDKQRLFKLAWDLMGSDFGSRHTLYELFYAGDPSMVTAGFHREFDKQEYLERVKRFLSASKT